MNTHAKGTRVENIAKKELIRQGYIVDQKNWSKWTGKDLFRFFDVVAISPDGEIKWIQVKSLQQHVKEWLDKWEEYEHKDRFRNVEVWLYQGNNEWSVMKF